MSIVGDSTLSGRASSPLGGTTPQEGLVVGRHYVLHRKIGNGGMAMVHLGWLTAPADFARVVAIKSLLPQHALDEDFVDCLRDEARINACLSHPNIVQVFDVVGQGREMLIIMEYVDGVPLNGLVQDANEKGLHLPLDVVSGILAPALHALHVVHEATDEQGKPIGIVHRDFTPPNIMVTREGHSKLLDLGIAKSRIQEHVTSPGRFFGKLGYCSPEQIRTGQVDRRTDVFAAGVVLWEMLTGRHLFHHPESAEQTMRAVLGEPIPPPSSVNPKVPKKLDEIVLRATQRAPERRFANARDLALALEKAVDPARPSSIAECLEMVSARRLSRNSRMLDRTRRCMARSRSGGEPVTDHDEESTVRHRMPSAPKPPTVPAAPSKPAWRWLPQVKNLALGALVLAFATGGSFGRWLFTPLHAASPPPAAPLPATEPRHFAPEIVPLPSPPPEPEPSPEILPELVVAPPPAEDPNHEEVVLLHIDRAPSPVSKPRKHRSAASRPRVVQQSSGQPDCNPPTYLGEDGIRLFKIECL
jgi:serine/threonine-protein kinase